jgi:hypothetical protein
MYTTPHRKVLWGRTSCALCREASLEHLLCVLLRILSRRLRLLFCHLRRPASTDGVSCITTPRSAPSSFKRSALASDTGTYRASAATAAACFSSSDSSPSHTISGWCELYSHHTLRSVVCGLTLHEHPRQRAQRFLQLRLPQSRLHRRYL